MPLLTFNILGYEADILSLAIAVFSLILAIVCAEAYRLHSREPKMIPYDDL